MGHPVLIAAELQPLIEPGQLAGLDVTWLPTGEPTPKGDYVAFVPLLSRWVGGTELKHLPKLRIVANPREAVTYTETYSDFTFEPRIDARLFELK